ncbi:MAG: 4Fe-4S dicluster domain-containing protein [Bacteroidales bacterium]
MAVDTKKCVGCSDCVVACQTENNVPIGFCRDWITETVDGSYPNVEIELRSERCNHCENAPCVRCCPTGASHIVDGGVVLVTHDECIGCGACIQSCPYDARYSHPDGYVDINVHFVCIVLKRGQLPACVASLSNQMSLFWRPG